MSQGWTKGYGPEIANAKEVFINAPDGARRKVAYAVKGALNEHIATTWLMRQGYDVFRNVAPTGRADLVAKNWETDELIWVDVKSQAYDPDAGGEWGTKQHEQERKYASSGIKYLVVDDNGDCRWYGQDYPKEMDDEEKYWLDPKSGKKFRHPRDEMSQVEWSTFSWWMLKYYSQDISYDQAQILYAANWTTKGRGRKPYPFQIANLQKVRNFLYRKITGKEPFPDTENDNTTAIQTETLSEAA